VTALEHWRRYLVDNAVTGLDGWRVAGAARGAGGHGAHCVEEGRLIERHGALARQLDPLILGIARIVGVRRRPKLCTIGNDRVVNVDAT